MADNQSLDYNVDIVMCIDATGSMTPIISEVKANAMMLRQQFIDEMKLKGKRVEKLRIKVIVFRDYGCDKEPMVESKFFNLDEEKEEFNAFVESITATGGGDGPENALEALALAIKSDWVKTGAVRRHVILMYTDSCALSFSARRDSDKYPYDMPEDLAELHDWWEGQDMEARAKRLIIFAPEAEPWNSMVDWQSTFLIASQAGAGCSDSDMQTCIRVLVNSI